jgi:hypothetical protein
MKNLTRRLVYSFLTYALSFLLLLLTIATHAQSPWLPDATDKGIGVEFLKPFFSDSDGISFFSTTQTISGRFRVSDKAILVTELPFSSFRIDSGDSEFALGNPYLGLIVNNSKKSYFLEAGLRVPLASDDKFGSFLVGLYSDYDRLEAYRPDMVSIIIKNNYLKRNDSGFILRLVGGLSFWVPTDDGGETEVLFDYGGHAGYDGTKIQVFGGFTGRLVITEADLNFSERTIHQFGVFARYKSKNVHPGLLFKIPLDSILNDNVNIIMGLNLLINLK